MAPPPAPGIEIAALERAEIALEPYAWQFAAERRDGIRTYFAGVQRERPDVWNGRVLLMRQVVIEDGVLRGNCFETDYASFCAWREWRFPDPAVSNIFAAAAVRSADGAYLLGKMAPFTANAGMFYFPCGTPEPADVDHAGLLDLEGNMGRELLEETGFEIEQFTAERGWTMVRYDCYIALLKHLRAAENADVLCDRMLRHIACERRPEFTDARIVRSPADFVPSMPRYVKAFLTRIWS